MKIVLAEASKETTTQRIAFSLEGLLDEATHVELLGDVAFVSPDPVRMQLDRPWRFARLTAASQLQAFLLLAEGLGKKLVYAKELIPSGHPFPQGAFSTVPGAPPTYLWTPYSARLLSTEGIGRTVSSTSGKTARIVGMSGSSYTLDREMLPALGEEVWLEGDWELSMDLAQIAWVSSFPDPIPVFGESHVELEGYWRGVRSFWATLEEEDRALIESLWRGLSQQWGNLFQRLSEIDASENLFDMLRYRRSHWCLFRSKHASFSARLTAKEGDTVVRLEKVLPGGSVDAIFQEPERRTGSAGDEGAILTLDGVPYLISEVRTPFEVEIVRPLERRFSNEVITVGVGGQLLEDSDTWEGNDELPRFSRFVPVSSFVLFDDEEWMDLSLRDLSGIDTSIPGTSRIQAFIHEDALEGISWSGLAGPFALPMRLSFADIGRRLELFGEVYTVVDVDDDGRCLLDRDVAVRAGASGAKFLDVGSSEFSGGQRTAGSKVFTFSGVHDLFHPSDRGVKISLRSGATVEDLTIAKYLSPTQVEVEEVALLTASGLTFSISADALLDGKEGRMRRMQLGRYEDGAGITFHLFCACSYRAYASEYAAEVPTLQSWTHAPLQEQVHEMLMIESVRFGYGLVHGYEVREAGTDVTVDPQRFQVTDQVNAEDPFQIIRLDGTRDPWRVTFYFQPLAMRSEVDYFLRDRWIYMRRPVGCNLWAQEVYEDHEDPYRLFGDLLDFYRSNTQAYYYGLLALWSAYWTGPNRLGKEKALNVLLSLPFARGEGLVSSVYARYTLGQKTEIVRILYSNGSTQEQVIPLGLQACVAPGQRVNLFDPLAGFREDFEATGTVKKNLLTDASRAPFTKEWVGCNVWVQSEAQETVASVLDFVEESRVVLDGNFEEETGINYTLLRPAVRIFDHVTYPGFLRALSSTYSLKKYALPQATAADYDIAMDMLENALFFVRIPASAFSSGQDAGILDIQSFLYRIKASYTDFILQLLQEDEDFVLITDDDTGGVGTSLDLTSRLRWEQATRPFAVDGIKQIFGVTTPVRRGWAWSKGAEILPAGELYDAAAPFSLDDVGKSIFLHYGAREIEALTTNPSTSAWIVESPFGEFVSEDQGRFIKLTFSGPWYRIVEVLSSASARVDRRITETVALVPGLVGRGENAEHTATVTAYHGPDKVEMTPRPLEEKYVLYRLAVQEERLDQETVFVQDDVTVDFYDTGVFVKRISPWTPSVL